MNDFLNNPFLLIHCIYGIIIVCLILVVVRYYNVKSKSIKILDAEIIKHKSENTALQKQISALEYEIVLHKRQIDDLKIENENLRAVTELNNSMPDEIKEIIQIRFKILNALFSSHISNNKAHIQKVNEFVKSHLSDIEGFMRSNRVALKLTNPEFITFFEEKGLTEEEIDYACLYAIGLIGKEVGVYLKKRSHVNISVNVRKKLGLDKHDTNIGIFIRNLLKKRGSIRSR